METKKTIRIFPNNKTWVSKDLKRCLNDKNRAFCSGDYITFRECKRVVRGKLREAKLHYRNKIEGNFITGNVRQAWDGLNIMMGRNVKRHSDPPITVPINDINNFFNRFNTEASSLNCNSICQTIPYCAPINLTELGVVASISKIKPGKARGPDGISGKVLKSCCHQLKCVLTRLFQALLQAGIVPPLWKESMIIPVPKGPLVYTVKDLRPIALTSVLCKTMERILVKYLMSSVGLSIDPLQFAYRLNRGTDDAVLTMMNFVTDHLLNSNAYLTQ